MIVFVFWISGHLGVNTKLNTSCVKYPSVAFGCALQTHHSKVPSIVPQPGLLQRPLAAGYVDCCCSATVAQLQYHPEKAKALRVVIRRQKLQFLAPSKARHCARI